MKNLPVASRFKTLSAATLLAYAAFHGLSMAQLVNGSVISLNFNGRDDNDAGNGGNAVGVLGIDEAAGVLVKQDWNNMFYGQWTGGTNNVPVTTSNLLFDDGQTGTSGASGVSITVQAGDSWHTDAGSATPDHKLMDGIIKANGGNSAPLFQFNGLARANYQVILYTMENGSVGNYSATVGGTTYYGGAANTFGGTFIQNTNTTAGVFPVANYVDFASTLVTNGSLTVGFNYLNGSDGAGVAGIQLKLLNLLDLYWSGAANGNWNTSSANWTGLAPVYTEGDSVVFQDLDANGAPVATRNVTVQAGGVSPGNTIISNSGGDYTFGGGVIGGTGSLTKSGNSALILNTANTYSGGTVHNAGTITLGVNNALPNGGSLTLNAAGTFDLNGRNQTLGTTSGAGVITNNGGGAGVVTVTNGSLGGFGSGASNISDGVNTVGVVKNTGGTFVLKSPNSYTGGTTVSDGTLTVETNTGLGAGAVTINNNATLNFGAQAGLFLGGVSGNGNTGTANPNTFVVGSAALANSNVTGGSLPTSLPNDTTAVYTGYINNTTGNAQTWAFAKSFDDFAEIKINGQVILNDGTWNNAVRTAVVLNPGLNNFELRLGQGGGGVGPSNSSWMGGTNLGIGVDYDNTDGAPIGSQTTVGGVGSNYQALPVDSGNGSVFVASVVDNVANTINVTGNATLNLGYNIGGVGSVAVGQVNIGASTLNVTGQAGVTNGTISAFGTDFNGAAPTFNVSAGMTFNPGLITGNLTNNVLKTGAGTLRLDQAQAYSGATIITGGTLQVTNPTGSATGTGNVSLVSGGVLAGNGTVSGNVTATGAGGIAPGFNGAGQLNIGGNLSLGSGSTLTYQLGASTTPGVDYDYAVVGGTFTLSGNISINLSDLPGFTLPNNYILATAGSMVAPGVTYTVTGTGLAAGLTYAVTTNATQLLLGVSSPTVTWTGAVNGVWDTATANWTPSPTYTNGNTVVFNDSGNNTTAMTITGTVTPFSTTFANTAAKTYSITGIIGGGGAINKTADGTVILAGANTFTGLVSNTGAGGKLQFGDGVTNNGAVAVNITNDATLEFANPNAQTYGAVISGTGDLVKSGAGNLTLTTAQPYGGNTTVNGGTLQLNVGGNPAGTLTGAGAITINNGGTVLVGSTDALGYNNRSATNAININVGGTLSVIATQRISNDRDINSVGGTLTSQGAGDGNGTYTLRNSEGAVYNFTSSGLTPSTFSAQDIGLQNQVTFNVTAGGGGATSDLNVTGNLKNIFGTGSLTKTGDGKMVLSGANSYTGGTTISAGIVQLGSGAATGTLGSGAVTNDASLVLNSTSTLAVGNTISGTGTVTQAGSGTSVLAGANAYSGGTLVTAGVLKASSNTALGTGAVTLSGGVLTLGRSGGVEGFTNFALNNGATVANDVLTLTTPVNNQNRSAFTLEQQQVTNADGFVASFLYTATLSPGGADGATFTIQNQSATALGGNGGALGYQGITNSGAVVLNIYNGANGGVGTKFVTNGARPSDSANVSVSPVSLDGGNPILVALTYDGALSTLTQVLTDTVTNATNSMTYTGVNFESLLGGQAGYIGFTASTGGASAIQTISAFTFDNNTSIADLDYDNSVVVSAGATAGLNVVDKLNGSTGHTTINDLTALAGSNLTISRGSLTMDSLNIGAGAVVTLGESVNPLAGGSDKGASSAVVPEPGTVGLLLIGALGMLGRRRRAAAK